MTHVQDNGGGGTGVGGSSSGGTNGRILAVFWDLLKGWIWGMKGRRTLRILGLILETLEMAFLI